MINDFQSKALAERILSGFRFDWNHREATAPDARKRHLEVPHRNRKPVKRRIMLEAEKEAHRQDMSNHAVNDSYVFSDCSGYHVHLYYPRYPISASSPNHSASDLICGEIEKWFDLNGVAVKARSGGGK